MAPGFLFLQLRTSVIPATILVILAPGLDRQWGKTGLFNAGVAAFFGVGAYTFAMLTTGFFPASGTYPGHWGPSVPFDLVPATLVAMAGAGALGVLFGVPTLLLRACYLAIAPLAPADIVRLIGNHDRRGRG